ncbi:hypothetical protein [Brevundimonas sp.]|uniref:hypothetical protein n=1 Tax=Brevundimonas sp. TaxID=1871086 RepID=UPI002D262E04|nr:hypothetical protein [Brevundimonas sp.]HYD26310.1 hypothetical protein [Brevundimonas sp.]
MRKLAFLAPLGAVLAVAAGPALADPASINVTLGADLQQKADELGEREVREQADRLAEVVRRALARSGRLDGARIDLVLTDLKPNRPTFEQLSHSPGLDGHRSISIGGAAIEGNVTTADGQVLPVSYDWYSTSLAEVHGNTTWQDADRAYQRLASRLADGRYVSR